jgi:hypothetical protein
MSLGSTQPLREINTRNLPGVKGRPACMADNLTALCEPIFLENVGTSTSHNPMGLHGLLQGQLYLFYLYITYCGTFLDLAVLNRMRPGFGSSQLTEIKIAGYI